VLSGDWSHEPGVTVANTRKGGATVEEPGAAADDVVSSLPADGRLDFWNAPFSDPAQLTAPAPPAREGSGEMRDPSLELPGDLWRTGETGHPDDALTDPMLGLPEPALAVSPPPTAVDPDLVLPAGFWSGEEVAGVQQPLEPEAPPVFETPPSPRAPTSEVLFDHSTLSVSSLISQPPTTPVVPSRKLAPGPGPSIVERRHQLRRRQAAGAAALISTAVAAILGLLLTRSPDSAARKLETVQTRSALPATVPPTSPALTPAPTTIAAPDPAPPGPPTLVTPAGLPAPDPQPKSVPKTQSETTSPATSTPVPSAPTPAPPAPADPRPAAPPVTAPPAGPPVDQTPTTTMTPTTRPGRLDPTTTTVVTSPTITTAPPEPLTTIVPGTCLVGIRPVACN